MFLRLSTRTFGLVLSVAMMAACSSSSTKSTGSPVTGGNGSTAPDPGLGGNGTTTAGGDPTPTPTPTPDPTPTPTPTPTPRVTHQHCGWMNDDIDLGKATLMANLDYFDAVHPFWWSLNADGTVKATSWTDDADVISATKTHAIKLMPLIYGGDDVSAIRSVIGNATTLAAHVKTVVALATSHNYDGIEIDYEHLWASTDRAGYTALVTQLATALHAAGKELSLAVPSIAADNGQNGYDFAALVAGGADVIHLMGYDFHGTTTDHLGPLAPLGWIDAVAARVQSLGIADHFVLGIGNYGVGSGWYANSGDAIAMCGGAGAYATTTTHMQTCPYGVYTAGTSPHCTTSKGDIWFEDATSAGEKAQTAKAHGLRGVSHYSLGGEPAGWFTALRAAYP